MRETTPMSFPFIATTGAPEISLSSSIRASWWTLIDESAQTGSLLMMSLTFR